MSKERSCAKGGGNTEVGWLTDNAYRGWAFVKWEKGTPKTSFLGIKAPKSPLPVLAYCCVDCSFMEMYVARKGDEQ